MKSRTVMGAEIRTEGSTVERMMVAVATTVAAVSRFRTAIHLTLRYLHKSYVDYLSGCLLHKYAPLTDAIAVITPHMMLSM